MAELTETAGMAENMQENMSEDLQEKLCSRLSESLTEMLTEYLSEMLAEVLPEEGESRVADIISRLGEICDGISSEISREAAAEYLAEAETAADAVKAAKETCDALTEELARETAKVAALTESLNECRANAGLRELEHKIVGVLQEAGAKNMRAVQALLDRAAIEAAAELDNNQDNNQDNFSDKNSDKNSDDISGGSFDENADKSCGEKVEQEIRRQVNVLRQAADSAFLFGAPVIDVGGSWSGFVPQDASDDEIGAADGGFRLRLDRARADGDGLGVIRLKQEAAREGIII